MSGNLVYLASPYSKYPYGRDEAFYDVCDKAADLMLQGLEVFCPIAHSHPIEVYGMDTTQSGEFWLKQDFAILKHCSKVMVYMMPGWEESLGVRAEILYAQDLGIPVEYISYEKNNNEVRSGHTEEPHLKAA